MDRPRERAAPEQLAYARERDLLRRANDTYAGAIRAAEQVGD
jgi:hypothetical protein